MTTIALIGTDGAGKTTIAKMLLKHQPVPLRYLYMGTSISSSSVALPTSRLIHYWKMRAGDKTKFALSDGRRTAPNAHELEHRNVERGRLGTAARVLNRMAEEWFRQLVVWSYQLRGYVVLCDRHFMFEYATRRMDSRQANLPIVERIHFWFLYNLYPQPGMVLFLDAPLDILLQRKQEWSVAHLQRHRAAMLELGQQMNNFVCVDASATVEQVYADVNEHISRWLASQ